MSYESLSSCTCESGLPPVQRGSPWSSGSESFAANFCTGGEPTKSAESQEAFFRICSASRSEVCQLLNRGLGEGKAVFRLFGGPSLFPRPSIAPLRAKSQPQGASERSNLALVGFDAQAARVWTAASSTSFVAKQDTSMLSRGLWLQALKLCSASRFVTIQDATGQLPEARELDKNIFSCSGSQGSPQRMRICCSRLSRRAPSTSTTAEKENEREQCMHSRKCANAQQTLNPFCRARGPRRLSSGQFEAALRQTRAEQRGGVVLKGSWSGFTSPVSVGYPGSCEATGRPKAFVLGLCVRQGASQTLGEFLRLTPCGLPAGEEVGCIVRALVRGWCSGVLNSSPIGFIGWPMSRSAEGCVERRPECPGR